MASQSQFARDLVIRARCGDQNAAAHIALIREGMLKGDKKLASQHKEVMAYIAANPMEGSGMSGTRIGKDASTALGLLMNAVSNGDTKSVCSYLVFLPYVGGRRALDVGALILADGPAMNEAVLAKFANCITDEGARDIFCHAILDLVEEDEILEDDQAFMFAGKALGRARAIQLVRDPSNPVSVFSQRGADDLYEEDEDDVTAE